MELASLVWDSYSRTSCLNEVKPIALDQNDEFWYGVGTQSVVNNGSNCMNPIPVMPIPYQNVRKRMVPGAYARTRVCVCVCVCVFEHLAGFGLGSVHETSLVMSPNV